MPDESFGLPSNLLGRAGTLFEVRETTPRPVGNSAAIVEQSSRLKTAGPRKLCGARSCVIPDVAGAVQSSTASTTQFVTANIVFTRADATTVVITVTSVLHTN